MGAKSKDQMSALLKRDLVTDEVTNLGDAALDPAAYFDRWLKDVAAARTQPAIEIPFTDELEHDIYVESRIGSNCEVNFEGVLHFDGYSLGNVVSPSGTLVLTRRGRIEADIDVRVAIIDGAVTGNITGREHVVLESDARVKGKIFTRALSMHLGAILDGDCVLSSASADAAPKYSRPILQVEDADVSLLPNAAPDEQLEEFLLRA